jgi:hypothetical protein
LPLLLLLLLGLLYQILCVLGKWWQVLLLLLLTQWPGCCYCCALQLAAVLQVHPLAHALQAVLSLCSAASVGILAG